MAATASGIVFDQLPNKARHSTTPKSVAFPDHAQWIKVPTWGMHHRRLVRHHAEVMTIIIFAKVFGTCPALHRVV